MFYFEKMLSMTIFSPMIFILILIFSGVSVIIKKTKTGLILLISGICMYLMSITPIINLLASNLENILFKNVTVQTDAYVLLGGGSIQNEFVSEPSRSAMKRIVKTAEVYRTNPKPIFISGGKIFDSSLSEGQVYKEVLVKLGVLPEDIILENKSRNTYENALYTKEKIDESGIKNISIVTSALHMPRSYSEFSKVFKDSQIEPIKCDYITDIRESNINNYIPKYQNMMLFNSIVWEYVGIVYYKLKEIIRK